MNPSRLTPWMLGLSCTALFAADSGNTAASPANSKQSTITTPPELKAVLWAQPSLLENPVAFALDEKGRMFLAETHRQGVGIPDNRGHAYWLNDDIAAKSIEDRKAKYEKWQSRTPLTTFTSAGEQVRLIEDTDGDGIADKTGYFAGPFKDMLDGTAAGLIAKDGDVWFTCIPHLWKLRDNDGDGKAEVQEKVITGFGVRDAFRGHDLHGLVWGPDGRLYFSMADRGYNIKLPDGKVLRDPMDDGRGGVFRCWPDGSGLERFALGLRNPQELAFDALGNLFTVDNNSDSGDQARLVHVVEGGDSGWCMTYQYGTPAITKANYNRGPWNAEGLWHLREPNQAAWVLPPLAHFTNGPSGMVFDPGVTAIGEKWQNSFFVCDFKGAAANSGVWNFTVDADGAGFKMGRLDKFLWNVLATDCDFGPDGRFYVSDFIDGWNGVGAGRVYAVSDPNLAKDKAVEDVRTIFAQGFATRAPAELAKLLNHADMRVRVRAQYALAEKKDAVKEVADIFVQQVAKATTVPAKLHGVWGLGSLRGQEALTVQPLLAFLKDKEPHVRAQAARALGDAKAKDATAVAAALLGSLETEDAALVQSELSVALSKQLEAANDGGLRGRALALFAQKLAVNDGKDLVLRHVFSLGLSASGTPAQIAALREHKSAATRMGAVLALRHVLSAELQQFLNDGDKVIVTEAARAIYDLDIKDALPALAALLANSDTAGAPEALTLRAVNAAYRVGTADTAKLLGEWAGNTKALEQSRREALWLLAHWAEPSEFERVLGFHRPLTKRDAAPALAALQPGLESLLDKPGKVGDEALRAALQLHATLPGARLMALLKDGKRDASTRTEALRLLAQEKDAALPDALGIASAPESPAALRIEGATLLAATDLPRAISVLEDVAQKGKTQEQQSAIRAMTQWKDAPAQAAITKLTDQLLTGDLPAKLQLDVLEAAATVPSLADKLTAWQSKLPAGDLLAPYLVCLEGGDITRGREIFANHTAAQCMRCHKVSGGGGLAGPELSGVGLRATRQQLLESLINPSAVIAPGYGIASVTLKDGSTVAGILKAEDKSTLTIVDADSKDRKVPLDQIAERTPAVSSMPPMFALLNKAEIRDLVAYLATLGKRKQDIVE